jgi:hypothetical protein
MTKQASRLGGGRKGLSPGKFQTLSAKIFLIISESFTEKKFFSGLATSRSLAAESQSYCFTF